MNATDSKLIAATVYDPRQPSIFGKGKKSERAEYKQIFCSCDSCPLRAKRQCIQISLFRTHCPYGEFRTETGPTQRAASYYGWVKDREKLAKQLGWMTFATNKLAFIGDFVYVPYSHADMRRDVPFTRHSAVFVSGTPFLKREDWTIENVLKLIDFHPQAMMGGEILSYQREEVPKLLTHLREVDPAMWEQLIARRPEFDTEPNHVGRKALLRTLAYPITIPPYDKRYPVAWHWDGEFATTTDRNGYEKTWGRIDPEAVEVKVKPAKNAEVVVADSSWVTNETIFVD